MGCAHYYLALLLILIFSAEQKIKIKSYVRACGPYIGLVILGLRPNITVRNNGLRPLLLALEVIFNLREQIKNLYLYPAIGPEAL